MTKNFSRRGILLASGSATAAMIATAGTTGVVPAQDVAVAGPLMMEGDLDTDALEAEFGNSLYVAAYNRSSSPKHNLRIGVGFHGGGGRIVSLGTLPDYDPPAPVPVVLIYLTGFQVVRFQFAWREGLNPFKRFPTPPKQSTTGKYFGYIALTWDERNRPSVTTYEQPI